MEIKPVKDTKIPNYPTLEYYIEYPEMFLRSIPESWVKNKYVATSLAAFVLCGSGSSNSAQADFPITIEAQKDTISKSESTPQKNNTIKVAPIFAHGEGSGAIGCIVLSPPVFLPEDEALKIISDMLKAQGIVLSSVDCPTIKWSKTCYDDMLLGNLNVKDCVAEIGMYMCNPKLNLAVKYVSDRDYDKIMPPPTMRTTVSRYNTKQAAMLLQEELSRQEKVYAGVFYDPMPPQQKQSYDDTLEGTRLSHKDPKTGEDVIYELRGRRWEKAEESVEKPPKARSPEEEISREQLTAQVNDFINWLKKEQIIK